ncbi:hypothetical protein EDB80DRAFT_4388 [Ilyonectria destructans]|nr:hypothetical protein EDB80DRAFT_4388 [Ilyonectria destructans]
MLWKPSRVCLSTCLLRARIDRPFLRPRNRLRERFAKSCQSARPATCHVTTPIHRGTWLAWCLGGMLRPNAKPRGAGMGVVAGSNHQKNRPGKKDYVNRTTRPRPFHGKPSSSIISLSLSVSPQMSLLTTINSPRPPCLSIHPAHAPPAHPH